MSIFKNKSIYSTIVLFLIIAGDCLSILYLHKGINPWGAYLWAITTSIFVVWIIRWFSFLGNPFWVRSKILTRLMANAIVPSWLGAFYLLMFIIHIGWLTDGSLNLFLKSNNKTYEVITSLVIAIVGIIVLIEFFPEARAKKTKIKNKIFVSGISALGFVPSSFDDKFSITPIVKILQETERKSEKCNLLILLSDYYTADKEINNKTLEQRLDIVKQTIQLGDPSVTSNEFNKLSINKKLKKLINEVAKHNFPDSKDWIENNLTIQFTNPCDYDDYPKCFKTLSKEVKKLDTNDTEICFNLTPGTAPISSIVTLLSIDSKRKLYYYSQDEASKEKPIKPVDKTKVPLENLLSQALETLKENN